MPSFNKPQTKSIVTSTLIKKAEEFFLAKNIDKAIIYFVKAIRLVQKTPVAWNGLGVCLYHKGKIKGAAFAFEKVLTWEPNNLLARENLHMIYWYSNQRGQAILQAQNLLAVQYNDQTIQLHLELAQSIPSKRHHALIIETTHQNLGNLHLQVESFGLITHSLDEVLLRLFDFSKTHESASGLMEVLRCLQPSLVIFSATDPAQALISKVCLDNQIAHIKIVKDPPPNISTKEKCFITTLDEFASIQPQVISSLSIPSLESYSPKISLTIDCQAPLEDPQFLINCLIGQTIPIPLFELFLITPEPALLHANFLDLYTPFPLHIVCSEKEMMEQKQGRHIVPLYTEELTNPFHIKRIIQDNINPPHIQFGTDNLQPRTAAQCCVLIRGWGEVDKTTRCLRAIRANYDAKTLRIIYVDNGSELNDYLLLVKEFTDIEFIRFPQNMGSCRGINAGMMLGAIEPHEFFILIDNDAYPPLQDPTWLERWLTYFKDDKVGAAGATSYYVSGLQNIELCPETYTRSFQRKDGSSGQKSSTQAAALSSFAIMFRRQALESIGWWADEQFEPGNCEDSDLSFRLKDRDWQLVIAKSVWFHHEGSVTFTRNWNVQVLIHKNREKLEQKFGLQRLKRLYHNSPDHLDPLFPNDM